MSTVLVIAAHPGDEVLGAGGTLARHVESGDSVHVLLMMDSSDSDGGGATGLVDRSRHGAKHAAEVLGITSLRFADLPPHQRLDGVAPDTLIRLLEAAIADLRPDIVYTHFAYDSDGDHGAVARAAWSACRPYAAPALRLLAAFEPSSTDAPAADPRGAFFPVRFVDVTDTIDRKLAAFGCYDGVAEATHAARTTPPLDRAIYWGGVVGRRAVEPFVVLRETV